MERKILSSFILSLSLAFFLLTGLPVQAQNSNRPPASNPPKKEEKKEADENVFPLYNGVTISVDLWGIGSKVLGGDFLSSEVAVDVNLKTVSFRLWNLDMAAPTHGMITERITKVMHLISVSV